MGKIRLKYIHQYRDRHGKVRRDARVPGRKAVPLPGLPGSAEFMETYQAALAGELPRAAIGAARTKPGTVNAAVVSYYGSVSFVNLAPGTQRMRRNLLENFRREHGDKRLAMLQRRHIADMVAEKAAKTPAAARNFLHIIRALMQHCVAVGMIDDDPTIGVKGVKVRSGGIHTWTEAEIARFEQKHCICIGSRARLALALLLYTGQRRSDVIRMGRQHIRDGAIQLTQRKTGAALAIPVYPDLAAVIEASPTDNMTFLVTRDGSPFADAGFGNLFREWCNAAELPRHCSAHARAAQGCLQASG